jgi:hypothetical protein
MYRIQRTKQKKRSQNTIFNKVILIGRLGQNAEAKPLRTTASTSSLISQPTKAGRTTKAITIQKCLPEKGASAKAFLEKTAAERGTKRYAHKNVSGSRKYLLRRPGDLTINVLV